MSTQLSEELPLLARVRGTLPRVLWTLGRWVVFLLSPKRRSHGFLLADFDGEDNQSSALDRAEEALHLIARADPRRLRSIRSSVKRLVIAPTLGADGEQWGTPWAVVLSNKHVRVAQPEQIALTLVHEATHARIRKAGIRYEQRLRARIERACVGEELAFARKLSKPDRWIRLISNKRLDAEYWTDEAFRARRAAGLRERLSSRVQT